MTAHQARALVRSGRWAGNALRAWRWYARIGETATADAIRAAFGGSIDAAIMTARSARAARARASEELAAARVTGERPTAR